MAVYEKIVDPGGTGDYTSLTAWEAGEQGLYSSGDTARAVCKRTTSAKDTARCQISSWTSGVIVEITVHPDYRHEGRWSDTRTGGNYVYALEWAATGNYSHALFTSDPNTTKFSGLLIQISNMSGYTLPCAIGMSHTAGLKHIDGCIVKNGGTTSSICGVNQFQGAGLVLCTNSTAYDFIGYASCRGFGNNVGATTEFYNCTAYNCLTGFSSNTTNNVLKNCAALNCTTCFSSTVSTSSDYNVSSDTTAPGTNTAKSKTAYSDYFVDTSAGDFHLKGSSSTLWGLAGVDLSTTFTTDIDGQTRSNWDIGADEYVATGDSLTASPITTGSPTVGTASMSQTHSLSLSGITAGAGSVGSPALGLAIDELTTVGIVTGTPAIGVPAIGQVHDFAGSGITTSAPNVGAPDLLTDGTDSLHAAPITAGQAVVGSPAIGQVHALIVFVVSAPGPVLSAPAIGQMHSLAAGRITSAAPIIAAPVPAQDIHTLIAAGIATGIPIIGQPYAGQSHSLVASGVTTANPAIGPPTLNRAAVLLPRLRTFVVPAENRIFTVVFDDRTYTIMR